MEKPELKICVVEKCDDKHEWKIWDLPKGTEMNEVDDGWIAHLNVHGNSDDYGAQDCQLRVAKIDISFYGKPIPNMFDS